MYEIELQYFKKGGKYYTEGKYMTDKMEMFEISDEIRKMRDERRLPGLSNIKQTDEEITKKPDFGYIIYVNTEKHPKGYPLLIV